MLQASIVRLFQASAAQDANLLKASNLASQNSELKIKLAKELVQRIGTVTGYLCVSEWDQRTLSSHLDILHSHRAVLSFHGVCADLRYPLSRPDCAPHQLKSSVGFQEGIPKAQQHSSYEGKDQELEIRTCLAGADHQRPGPAIVKIVTIIQPGYQVSGFRRRAQQCARL